MVYVAVLGYGVVGSGVVELLIKNKSVIEKNAGKHIKLKYVLDLRNFEGELISKYITHDINDILVDDSIKIVVESMGGLEPSYSFVKKCLEHKKSVVTSNKELVEKHGAELLELAKSNDVNFLFEASTGGGIPIIRSIKECVTSDEIIEIEGILNGTTNYILSKMSKEGKDFEEMLFRAQEKGYAEKDPTNDIEGYDTCRKIAILASLVLGKNVSYEDVYTEGITKITKMDLDFAKAIGGTIKLIAKARKTEDGVFASVSPMIIGEDNPLSNVNGVYNGILLKGNAIGELMFYGKGAGKLATATAVISDLVDCVKNENKNIGYYWSSEKQELISIKDIPNSRFIRILFDDEKCINSIKNIFGDVDIVFVDNIKNQLAFETGIMKDSEIQSKLELLKKENSIKEIISKIKIER